MKIGTTATCKRDTMLLKPNIRRKSRACLNYLEGNRDHRQALWGRSKYKSPLHHECVEVSFQTSCNVAKQHEFEMYTFPAHVG